MTDTVSLGGWTVDIQVGKLPQGLATAFAELQIMGAEYTPIAYLGSQVVNGINHAVLAEQLLITGKDTKNVVVMIFNERAGQFTLSNIERVVESGAPMGGTRVDVQTEIPAEAKAAFAATTAGWVGANIEPFALLATQVVKGVNYVFACKVTGVTAGPVTCDVDIVTVNPMMKRVNFCPILESKLELQLGCPLGEWP